MAVRMTFPMMLREEVEVDGRIVRLNPLPFRIVETLVLAGPRATSTADLIEAVYPNPWSQPITAIDIFDVELWRLRKLGLFILPTSLGGFRLVDEAEYRARREQQRAAQVLWSRDPNRPKTNRQVERERAKRIRAEREARLQERKDAALARYKLQFADAVERAERRLARKEEIEARREREQAQREGIAAARLIERFARACATDWAAVRDKRRAAWRAKYEKRRGEGYRRQGPNRPKAKHLVGGIHWTDEELPIVNLLLAQPPKRIPPTKRHRYGGATHFPPLAGEPLKFPRKKLTMFARRLPAEQLIDRPLVEVAGGAALDPAFHRIPHPPEPRP